MANDPHLALTVSPLLERAGYRVRVAVNESQSLAVLGEELPLVALCALDGTTVFDELKSRFGHLPFALILISDEEDAPELAQRLYAHWLPTSLDASLLLETVRRAASVTPCLQFARPGA